MNRRNFLFSGLATFGVVMSSSPLEYEREDEMLVRHIPVVKALEEGVVLARKHHRSFPRYTFRKRSKIVMSAYDKAILVKTIWGETRGESRIGRMAVVHVILNRINSDNPIYRSYRSISEVCLRKFQFSCWLDKLKMRHIKVDDNFREIKKDVDDAILAYERGIDYSNGALLYYSDKGKTPNWVAAYDQVNRIGHHHFFA